MRFKNLLDFARGVFPVFFMMLLMNPVTAVLQMFSVIIGIIMGVLLSLKILTFVATILGCYSLYKLLKHPKNPWEPPITLGVILLLELIFLSSAWFTVLIRTFS